MQRPEVDVDDAHPLLPLRQRQPSAPAAADGALACSSVAYEGPALTDLPKSQGGRVLLQDLHADLNAIVHSCFDIMKFELFNSDPFPDCTRRQKHTFARDILLHVTKIEKNQVIIDRINNDVRWTRSILTLVRFYITLCAVSNVL